MTSPICSECRAKFDRGDNYERRQTPEHHGCLKAYLKEDEYYTFELFHNYIFDGDKDEDDVYHDTVGLIPALNLTHEQVENALEGITNFNDDPDNQMYINIGGLRAIFEDDLFDSDEFWENYYHLIQPPEIYHLMKHGYNLPKHLHDLYHMILDQIVQGHAPVCPPKLVYIVAALCAHHATTRQRKEDHWRSFFASIYLAKVIRLYHIRRYAPGSAQFQLAKTRFETGSYQV